MAENPYVNKVEYAGQTLMDLTNDTATPSDVLNGATFHDRSGAPQTGNLITHDVYDGLDSTSTSDALSAKQGKVLNSNKANFSVITGDEISNVDIGEIYNNHIGGIARKESSDSGTATTVGEEINKLIKSVASLAIVIPESKAPQAIPAGKFVIIKNDSNVVPGIYQLKAAMAENDWVSVYNLRSFSDGILSLLNDNLGSPSSASGVTGDDAFSKINTLNSKIPTGNAYSEILILAGSDINNYKTAGTFIVPSDSTAAQISNMPLPASGRLIVMNRTTSSYMVQEYYPTTAAPLKYIRNYNNGTWTNWELVALNSDIPVIKTNSFTGTTSGSGNVSKAHTNKVIVLSAWTDVSDRIVTPFPGAGAVLAGQYTWWFQVFSDNSSHSVIANTSVTIYYAYIEME